VLRCALHILSGKYILNLGFQKACGLFRTPFSQEGRSPKLHLPRWFPAETFARRESFLCPLRPLPGKGNSGKSADFPELQYKIIIPLKMVRA
jgi:hypothetical protein